MRKRRAKDWVKRFVESLDHQERMAIMAELDRVQEIERAVRGGGP